MEHLQSPPNPNQQNNFEAETTLLHLWDVVDNEKIPRKINRLPSIGAVYL